jgi:hypothetical protein
MTVIGMIWFVSWGALVETVAKPQKMSYYLSRGARGVETPLANSQDMGAYLPTG